MGGDVRRDKHIYKYSQPKLYMARYSNRLQCQRVAEVIIYINVGNCRGNPGRFAIGTNSD
jgi:hypothetical protein